MNPEVSNMAKEDLSINKIINKKTQEVEMTGLEKKKLESAIDNDTDEKESIILFTEKELKRAKSYIDKDWKPDETINIAAWEYVSKNPVINESINKQVNKIVYLEENQVVNAK